MRCFRGSKCNNNNNNNGNGSFVGYTQVTRNNGSRIPVYKKGNRLFTANGRKVIKTSIKEIPNSYGYYTPNQISTIKFALRNQYYR